MSDYNKRNTYQQLSPRSLMQTVLICPKCGEELQQGVARCNYCGYSLNNGTADSQPPVSPGFAGANAPAGGRCKSCVGMLRINARFCTKCGAPVEPTVKPTVKKKQFCTKCGTPRTNPNAAVCPKCGNAYRR